MSDYYDTHPGEYFESTFNVDPSSFLTPLTERLNKGATALDIGCGSGRDLLWLKKKGFQPTGFENSSKLAALAHENTGCPVIVGDFFEYDFSQSQFDALLLVGSLVHIDHSMMKPVLSGICQALSAGGFAFLSLKEGDGLQHSNDGRVFYLWQPQQLQDVFSELGLSIIDVSRQVSKVRKSDIWLGYVLRKN